MEPFRFKQFEVKHDVCAHKVGTDAVVLGAWATVRGCNTILDIGTGSGVIALMLAQRSGGQAQIDAVEPADVDAAQANENAKNSPWPNQIVVHHVAVQNYIVNRTYDLIVSNPPFFNASLKSPRDTRTYARHTETLSHNDLLEAVARLLRETGKFAVILPTAEALSFERLAASTGLHVVRELAIFSRPAKKQERTLMEFCHSQTDGKSSTLTIHAANGTWSEEYKQLTSEFYLAF